jgi:hypothetical protein
MELFCSVDECGRLDDGSSTYRDRQDYCVTFSDAENEMIYSSSFGTLISRHLVEMMKELS